MLTERSERIRAARKLTRRAARDKGGAFLAEGVQAVREAVAEGPDRVIELFVGESAQYADLRMVVAAAEDAGIPVREADDGALAALSETVTPQGLVAVCRSVYVELDDVLVDQANLVTVLAEVRDPGNAGSIVRCSDAAGADAVVFTHGSVDPQSGKAVRASAGSLFHVPTVLGPSVAETIDGLRAHGMTIIVADGSGSLDLHDADDLLARPTAWLFGNEAWGVSEPTRRLADHVVRIPIYGRAESLNLATAAAVCLYASARAQRAKLRDVAAGR